MLVFRVIPERKQLGVLIPFSRAMKEGFQYYTQVGFVGQKCPPLKRSSAQWQGAFRHIP